MTKCRYLCGRESLGQKQINTMWWVQQSTKLDLTSVCLSQTLIHTPGMRQRRRTPYSEPHVANKWWQCSRNANYCTRNLGVSCLIAVPFSVSSPDPALACPASLCRPGSPRLTLHGLPHPALLRPALTCSVFTVVSDRCKVMLPFFPSALYCSIW